jgi:peptidoglycan/LPS O-acetylase OafA/YrhL
MNPVRFPYRPHLDGLRGVAVLAVLCYHAFPRFVPGGFAGVDVFFVISGFLISGLLYADFAEPDATAGRVLGRFYARRIRRIFPALVVVLAACFILGYRFLLPGELERLSVQLLASAGFFLNFLLAGRTGYFDPAAESNPLLHLWSLAVEEQFYLIWPFIIWLAWRGRVRILPVAVFLAAGSFCWNAQKTAGVDAAGFYLPQMRMWELLIGAIAAAMVGRPAVDPTAAVRPRSRAGSAWAQALSAAGFVAILAGCLIREGTRVPPNAWTLLPTLGTVGLVCAPAWAWINRRLLCLSWLRGLGLISYPLYLWHWPLLTFARIASHGPVPPLASAALLVLSGVLAWLTFRLVETPIRRRAPTLRRTLMLGTAMVAVAALGWSAVVGHGFPSRFPPQLSAIADFKYDPTAAVREGAYFLIGDQDERSFKQDPNEILPSKPTLYLWGDSHAAALYAGIEAVYGKEYNIVQRTAAQTPPFLPEAFNPGNAQQISRYVLASIIRDRPAIVVLHAEWQRYDWRNITPIAAALKAAGVHHIVVVGPVPQWLGSLRQQLFNFVRTHHAKSLPVRLAVGLDPAPLRLDGLIAALCAQAGVEYVSPCRILGNADGFLVRTGDAADSLMTYDAGHLSVSGSDYLVAHFPRW